MKKTSNFLIKVFSVVIFMFCVQFNSYIYAQVSNAEELQLAITSASPGSIIVMKNGEWKDIQIKFFGIGTAEKPITLRAETPGKVMLQGKSNLKLGGKHLVVDGLYLNEGASPSRSVIQFYINDDTLANHCRVTNCVIEDFNKPSKNKQDIWVVFKGRHNQLDHCYIAGKSNRGPTVRVELAGNESIKNYHQIINNHFGPRPPKGGPSAETIQLGNSSTSMAPSYTMVAENFFDRCNGEVEVISSKTNFNEFRNNVFYKSEGSLVTRHGNYCTIDGNYFIGDEDSPFAGGIRLIGTGHWVTNNYFYNLRGEVFRAPLAVMNGIKRSAINRYIQVTDVVVAYNTWVDCKSPWQFGVGSNVDQKDVLPASEIRSEIPIRTIVANNIIYNTKGDPLPIFRHDSIDGIKFYSNVIDNQDMNFKGVKGLKQMKLSMTEVDKDIWMPSNDLNEVEVYQGFEFDKITKDLFGNARAKRNSIGATNGASPESMDIFDMENYGPQWYDSSPKSPASKTISVGSSKELIAGLKNANDGDVILLMNKSYEIKTSLIINKTISIQSNDDHNKSTIKYTGAAQTPAFEMNPKGHLTLQSVKLVGDGMNYAFATLRENMSSLYNLKVDNSEISNFDYVLKAYKNSFSEHIYFRTTIIRNCSNGLKLASEDDDRGEYNVENLHFFDCRFENIEKNVVDYYRGGYDESTVGGNLIVDRCSFINCGGVGQMDILINTYGIINVDISNSEFFNNNVILIARLWGAKNNSESNNTIKNSGKFMTEQNLPQKLMY